jgi:hypothetical protein
VCSNNLESLRKDFLRGIAKAYFLRGAVKADFLRGIAKADFLKGVTPILFGYWISGN